MTIQPRIIATGTALPPYAMPQAAVAAFVQTRVLGDDWREQPEAREQGAVIAKLFNAAGVQQRQSAIDVTTYYQEPRSTGARMADYRPLASDLGGAALQAALAGARDYRRPESITDFLVASCTGYCAPGL